MAFLGEENEEVQGPLSSPVENAGDGSVSGATRGLLVSTREMLMGRVLERALSQHQEQTHRAVWSWPERDKLSAQFLLHLPGHNSTLTPEEFSECTAALLCLPSPACWQKLGERVGRSTVDLYGDNVVSQKIAGDGWRRRHDDVKEKIFSLLRWAGLEVRCEVFNLFAGLIPQRGLSRLERGRKRQGMVADFMVRMPGDLVEAGGRGERDVAVLAELKIISSCPTRYSRAPRHPDRAVVRRAAQLPREYERKAQNMDYVYGGVPEGEEGPVARKLATFPFQSWVFGAWNEASHDVHSGLVQTVARARLKHEQLLDEGVRRHRKMSDTAALALLTGQIRRSLSLVSARATARCLLDRLEVLGSGADGAAGRRRWREREVRRMDREQRAHALSMQHGRAVLKQGEFYLH